MPTLIELAQKYGTPLPFRWRNHGRLWGTVTKLAMDDNGISGIIWDKVDGSKDIFESKGCSCGTSTNYQVVLD